MNIDKLKQLENARKKTRDLQEANRKAFVARRKSAIDNAVDDFKTFFRGKEFTINNNGAESVVASYGETRLTLNFHKPDLDFGGIVSRLDMKMEGAKQGDFVIPILTKGHGPRIIVSEGVIRPQASPKTEDERMDADIALESERLAAHETVALEPEEPFVYGLSKDSNLTEPFPRFDSFKELLTHLFT